jgi:hypothetical protein
VPLFAKFEQEWHDEYVKLLLAAGGKRKRAAHMFQMRVANAQQGKARTARTARGTRTRTRDSWYAAAGLPIALPHRTATRHTQCSGCV